MVLIKSLIVLFALQLTLPCNAEDASDMVKRINDRYDDFFRDRREREERELKFSRGSDERKKMEAAHQREMEQARADYVKNRRARPSLEHLRVKHEAAEKERQAQNEMLRRRYVERRDTVEQYLKKGRTIPELKEFDLEGY